MKSYSYYPGCSLKGTGRAYEESLLPVLRALDVEVKELSDWNCCGATAYMSTEELQSVALAARNLAIAEEEKPGADLMAPCAACWLVLTKTKKAMEEDSNTREKITRAMDSTGLRYGGSVNVRHPLDILANDVGVDAIRAKVKKPLKGLNVAPYYGCQLVRPYPLFDVQHDPQTMDDILKACGATVVDYPYKTRCCGGSQTGTLPDVGLHLVYRLLKEAKTRGADVVAVVCPLCQFNLDGYQDRVKAKYGLDPVPVVYLPQLMGVAMGMEARKVGLGRGIVPAGKVIQRRVADVA